MKVLIEKEWHPGRWNEDRCENPNEVGNIEPLNSAESSLPIGEDFATLSEEVNPILFENT